MKRLLLYLGIGVISLLVALGGFWYWINIPPKVDIPTPQMPSPNGYDYFIKAGKAFVPDENGVDKMTDAKWKEGKQYPLAPKEAWLQENAQALQLLREGLKYPAFRPPEMPSNEYSHFRDLTRALAVESHVHAAHGNWESAADSALDGLAFSYAFARGGPLIAGLASNATATINLREIHATLPHLDSRTAKRIAKKMEWFYTNRYLYSETMQVEKWRGQAQNMEMMRGKNWRLHLVFTLSYPKQVIVMLKMMDESYEPPSRLETVKEFLKYSGILVMRKKTLMNNYTEVCDMIIANGLVPYKNIQPMPRSKDPLSDLSIDSYERTRWNWGRVNTHSILTMTMLALHAYKLDHGNYPDNLQKLVPAYLQEMPIDPFDGVQPLRYKLNGEKYFLWSIGPDSVDDNATPIENKDRQGKARHRHLDPKDKGDIVAGITMP